MHVLRLISISKFKTKLAQAKAAFQKSIYLQLLVIPGLIYFFIFHYIPMYGVIIAFKNYSLRAGIFGSKWVGLLNFQRFFSNPNFYQLLENTFKLSIYGLIFGFAPPIILAIMLNETYNIRYRKLVQTVSYLPHFVSTVAIAGIVIMILSPKGGMINNLLGVSGIKPIYFMSKPQWFRTIFIASGIWQNTGFNAIIYVASLSSVDPQIYEAATIDGASRLRKIWHISIPCIQNTIIILLILSIGGIMNVNTEKVLLLQNPLTYETSDVIGTYVYRRGLVLMEYSYGAAVGLFNSIINIILLNSANYLSRRFTESSLW